MEKIELNDNCKRILRAIKDGKYEYPPQSDLEDINLLRNEKLIKATPTLDGFYVSGLTNKGRAYLHSNPKLKNPSIWDDKKYLINTAISVIALILSIIALLTNN